MRSFCSPTTSQWQIVIVFALRQRGLQLCSCLVASVLIQPSKLRSATPIDVVDAAFNFSYLWKHVQCFRLVQSIRDPASTNLTLSPFVLLAREKSCPFVTLPGQSKVIGLQYTFIDEHTSTSSTCTVSGVTGFGKRIDFVYPDQGILAPTNVSIDQINNRVLHLLPIS